MKKPKSRPSDPEKIRNKIETALRKHDRGEPLNEKEMTIVYWVRYGGGCHACGGSGVEVIVSSSQTSATSAARG